MADLEVKTEQGSGYGLLSLSGDLDYSGDALLDQSLRRVEEGEPQLIVLDMRRLNFIDSGGIKALVSHSQRIRDHGRRFAIVRGPEKVHRVLEWTGVTRSLEVADDPADLLDRL